MTDKDIIKGMSRVNLNPVLKGRCPVCHFEEFHLVSCQLGQSEAENARLQAELKTARACDSDALVAREGELVEKARAYLKRGLHLMGCNGFPHTKEPCDCGFQALKDALAALGEKV